MDIKLVNKLHEDIFEPISATEMEEREKNRPPRVLKHSDPDGEFMAFMTVVLAALVVADISKPDSDAYIDFMDSLYTGTPYLPKALNDYSPKELLSLAAKYYKKLKVTTPFKPWVLKQIQDYTGESFTDIEGLNG